jgi:uncharacterized membrane protein
MSGSNFLIVLIVVFLASAVAYALDVAGLPEEHAKYRVLALLVTSAGCLVSILGSLYLLTVLPFWLALPVGVLLLAAAFVCVFFLVQKILPKKISRPR